MAKKFDRQKFYALCEALKSLPILTPKNDAIAQLERSLNIQLPMSTFMDAVAVTGFPIGPDRKARRPTASQDRTRALAREVRTFMDSLGYIPSPALLNLIEGNRA